METVFHFGENSEKYMHEFDDRRVDFLLQDISVWTVMELKAILTAFQEENRTFAAAQKPSI